MKKILYLMGIDWYWIKQRPQIIAEYLNKDFDITVVYVKEIFQKQSLRANKDELPKSIAVPIIPYRDKNKIAFGIQNVLFHNIKKQVNDYDIIWIGHPLLYRYIPNTFRGKLVYDCMDNHEALCNDKKIRATIHETEGKLINDADLIFASSLGLKKKIEQKCLMKKHEKVILIRNGVTFDKIHIPQNQNYKEKEKVKIGYFGTISEWFDFSVIEKSLKENSNIEYYLWGPTSRSDLQKNERIKFKGVIEHHCLWEKIKNMDCLIMPFKINEIIEDVDPVKLYEYISMGKPIISVYYDEIERFDPYVYFYSTACQYCNVLEKIINCEAGCKYDKDMQKKFLQDNTWDVRYQEMKKYVKVL